MQNPLFERIGGKEAVTETVMRLYKRILGDALLCPFFEDINVDRLRSSQTAFVTMAFGGPNEYMGASLRKAHERLVARGLSDAHFNAVAGHLKAVLEELGVADDLIAEALAIVETTRHDVLNR